MEGRFTASRSEGSQSRVVWLRWMLGGVVFSTALVQSVIFLDAITAIIASGWQGEIFNIVVSLIEAVLVALVASACIRFARRRLPMPNATWLAIALPPAAIWVIALRDAVTGSYLLVYVAAVMSLGLAAAWLLDRRSAAGSTRRTPCDAT